MKQFWKAICVISMLLGYGTVCLPASAQSDPDTLVYLFSAEDITRPFIKSFRPTDGFARDNVGAIQNLYETLFAYKKDSYELEPLLATDYTLSEDGKTYTFTLREGVKFHSGNDFSCKDVAWSFKYLFIRELGLYWFEESLLGQRYDGATAYVATLAREAGIDVPEEDWDPTTWDGADAAYAAYWELVEKAIVCVDDFTFQLNLVKPDAQLPYKVATYAASIIDSQWAIDNGEWNGEAATYRAAIPADIFCYCGFLATNLSSTAPYKLVSWKGDVLVAEAFEDYWGEQPSIPVVFYKNVQDVDSVFLSLQQGDGDATQLSNQWNLLEGKLRGAEGIKILEDPNWFLSDMPVITFNQSIKDVETGGNWLRGSGQLDGAGIPADFFTDKNVRLGFAHIFNAQAFIESQYFGRGQSLTMPIFPGYASYDASLPSYNLYDPAKAEAYFRAAYDGKLWELGFEFTVGDSYNPVIPYMEQLKLDLETLNPKFKMTVKAMTEEEWFEVDDGQLPLTFATILADYPDYDFFVDFYENNSTHINNEIAALVATASDTLDAAERKALHKKIAEMAFEEMILYILPASQAYVVTSDALEGAYFNPFISTNFYWKDVSKK